MMKGFEMKRSIEVRKFEDDEEILRWQGALR